MRWQLLNSLEQKNDKLAGKYDRSGDADLPYAGGKKEREEKEAKAKEAGEEAQVVKSYKTDAEKPASGTSLGDLLKEQMGP